MKVKKEGNAETRKTVWLESPNPDLLVRVSQYESKDRGPYLVGIAYTREPVTQILPEIKRTRMIRNGDSVELCRKIIVNRVTDAVKARTRGKGCGENQQNKEMNRFLLALEEYLKKNGGLPHLARNTERQYVSFYNRVFEILKDTQDCAILLNTDLEPVVKELTRQVSGSKLSKKSEESIRNRVQAIISYASTVYKEVSLYWNHEHPEARIPELQWSVVKNARVIREQPKMLKQSMRERFCRRLYNQIAIHPIMVKGAALMLLNLRTAEAAAVQKTEVQFVEDKEVGSYCVIDVFYQTPDGIERTTKLKNDQSTRRIPAGYWFTEVLKKCFAILEESGETGMVAPNKLADWILNELKAAGCNVNDIKPPASELEDVGSLAAYILRRDAASLMKNRMGMTSPEIDFFMGHKQREAKSKHADFTLAEEQKKLVMKMNRICYMPELARFPAYVPIRLEHGCDMQTIDYEKLVLDLPPYSTRCSVEVTASEPGESVTIVCPKELEELIQIHTRKETKKSKPALGCTSKEEEHE